MNRLELVRLSVLSASLFVASGLLADTEIDRENELTAGEVVTIPGDGRARVTLDRTDATYACNETATFTVTCYKEDGTTPMTSGTVKWQLDNYGASVISSGEQDLSVANPFTVSGTLAYPGFLRLTVKGQESSTWTDWRSYSAAYAPAEITTAVAKPADFAAFWANGIASLASVPLDPQTEQVDGYPKSGYNKVKVSFATLDDKRVYGVLCYPTDQTKAYPLVVSCPGAGTGFTLDLCRGDANHVRLYMSVHGFPIGTTEEIQAAYGLQEQAWKDDGSRSVARAYPVGGLYTSATRGHYYDKILGINRAIDWAAARTDVNPGCITYNGTSQGGGMGLILAGLNKNFTRIYVGVPALCDLDGCLSNGRQSGWPRMSEYEPQQTAEDLERLATMQANARYFDAAYFAEQITVPVRMTVGYADESCAPHSVFAAYNALGSSDKYLYQGIGGVHSSAIADSAEINAWLDTVSPRTIYVDGSVATSGDGRSWATAFKTIQEGVNAASAVVEDTVLVAPGVYSQPDQVVTLNKKTFNASVCISGAKVTLKSLKGKEVTHIVGRRGDGSGGNNAAGEAPAVCVAIGDNGFGSTVEGFTIRDGETSSKFGTASRSGGVGNPTYASNDAYPDTCSNFWYVAYCTISNCCAGRGAAVTGGTLIGCYIADNVSYNSTVASTYSYAYNCIFTRNGMSGRSSFDFWTAVNCTCANEPGGERGAITTKGGDAYNCAFVDCGKGGDNNNAGRIYSCVYDNSGATAFSKKTVVDDTVLLEKLANETGATGHDQLFMGAVRNDFRPVNGGYLYGKDGHYGKLAYTRLDFIPPAYKQRDFYGKKLADDAVIPIGVILPAVTPQTKPMYLMPNDRLATGMTVDGVKVGVNGQFVYGEKAGDPIRLGYKTATQSLRSLTTEAFANAYPLADESCWTRFAAKDGSTYEQPTFNMTTGILYVDRENGKDDDASYDGKTPETAFQSLQKAVDAVPKNMTYVVYVAEGVYDTNSKEVDSWAKSGKKLRARVVLTADNGTVQFRATGRRSHTIVEGAYHAGADDGAGATALRCAVNASSAGNKLSFSGFTFRKGRCDVVAEDGRGGSSGGFLDRAENNLIVMDSVVTDCASQTGSAGYFTAFLRCLFKDNKALSSSAYNTCGVVSRGFAAFCVFEDNPSCTMLQAFVGGSNSTDGYYSRLFNCTVYQTQADRNIRGSSGPFQNTVVLSTGAMTALTAGYEDADTVVWGYTSCPATGVMKKNPKLFDPAHGDYRPNENSPVWQAGSVPDAMKPYCCGDFNGGALDISADGTRITLGAVHAMGAPTPGTKYLIR